MTGRRATNIGLFEIPIAMFLAVSHKVRITYVEIVQRKSGEASSPLPSQDVKKTRRKMEEKSLVLTALG
jgi:hypothetical protein